MKCLLSLLILFFTQPLGAQVLSVVSHYPSSAFVTHRLLPFTISGGRDLKVVSIDLIGTNSCVGFADPFYNDVFHFYCREPEAFDAVVTVVGPSGRDQRLDIRNLSVVTQRAPGDEFDSPFGGDSSPQPFGKREEGR